MALRSPFAEVISNPLVIAMLGLQGAGTIAGALNRSQQQAQQEAITAAEASGHPVTELPRRGLSSLIAKTGLISPNVAVDPNTMNLENIALQNKRMQALQTVAGLRGALGPGFAKAPGMSDLITSAGLTPEALAAPTLHEQQVTGATEARAKSEAERERHDVAMETGQAESRKAQEAQRDINNQLKASTLQIQQSEAETRKQMAAEKNETAKRARFDQEVRLLDSQRQNVGKMLTAATPADPKTVQSHLDALNGRAKTLQQIADKEGYEYDPSQFAPLQVKSARAHWYSLGPTSSIEEGEAPTATAAGTDPLIGQSTRQPDGIIEKDGKHYTVKGGKIIGVQDASAAP
jgi:hypothetical protein